jgi:glycogen debranching enzyme
LSEIIRIKDDYYILATSALADDRPRVLKQDDTFAIFDHYGDIQPIGLREQGVYQEGTRFLSRLFFHIGGARPLFLSSNVLENNALLAIDLTNPDLHSAGKLMVPRGTLHIFRSKFLWQGRCYERLRLSNFGSEAVELELGFEFDADFVDIFEVRGSQRPRRGVLRDQEIRADTVVIAYQGLDGVVRRAHLSFHPPPERLSSNDCRIKMRLDAKQEDTVRLTLSCENNPLVEPAPSYDQAFGAATELLARQERQECHIHSSNEQFNRWVDRSVSDVRMMVTELPTGPYPYAGIPWFSTPFGRDGIWTAIQAIWFNPGLARGVLRFLAAHQARAVDEEADAEPGKILHELRKGEMAALREIPFGCYYGSVDATPLFVMLAGEYLEVTGDRDLISDIWPNICLALKWIDSFGDVDGDGFVEYARRSPKGLIHQGWKDSHDAVSHADGALAEGPIALCEVQGYVYAAKQTASMLARMLNNEDQALGFEQQAQQLKERFDRVFWSDELSTYVLALDGKKRPCQVRTSNAGHCLFAGIATPERAEAVGRSLLSADSFSGWGIRTLSTREVRYNPMSYHNGSVWPHDNGVVGWGLARYGRTDRALQIFESFFQASKFFDLTRLPELFCGFARRSGEGPTLYPVACAPQAWSAATVFILLRACLGMHFNLSENRLSFSSPRLPAFLRELEIQNLRIGSNLVDLRFQRFTEDVGVNVERREGDLQVTVVK